MPKRLRARLARSISRRLARDGVLRPAGQVRFGFAGKGLWHTLDQLCEGLPQKGFIPVQFGLVARVKFFGRYKRGAIRERVEPSWRMARSGGDKSLGL